MADNIVLNIILAIAVICVAIDIVWIVAQQKCITKRLGRYIIHRESVCLLKWFAAARSLGFAVFALATLLAGFLAYSRLTLPNPMSGDIKATLVGNGTISGNLTVQQSFSLTQAYFSLMAALAVSLFVLIVDRASPVSERLYRHLYSKLLPEMNRLLCNKDHSIDSLINANETQIILKKDEKAIMSVLQAMKKAVAADTSAAMKKKKGADMRKWITPIFLSIGFVAVIAIVAVSVNYYVGDTQAAEAGITAALVYVTGVYVFLTWRHTEILKSAQWNTVAPVVALEAREEQDPNGTTNFRIWWSNIGAGPALNFRCWVEDSEHKELRTKGKAITFEVIQQNGDMREHPDPIKTNLTGYKLGAGFLRAQYDSILGKTYETTIHHHKDGAPQMRWREVPDNEVIIL